MRAGDVVVAGRDVGRERPERVERRFAAPLELLVHVLLDHVHGDVAGAFVHHLHAVAPRALGQFALRVQFGELRFVVRVGNRTGTQTVADGKAHVVRGHDFADLVPMRVEEIFLMMRETPLGHDRAAAADDAGHALRRQRNVSQQHAGMDGEVIHALLRLFDERVPVNLPGQFLRFAIHFFQRLINRHGADGHGRVADDPFARLVDVLAGGKIHHRVRAPLRRPPHLLDFLLDARRDGAVADVGVDLHQEIAADDHRLGFGMIDVGGDDGATARDFVADKFRGDFAWDGRAERFAGMLVIEIICGAKLGT